MGLVNLKDKRKAEILQTDRIITINFPEEVEKVMHITFLFRRKSVAME